MNTVGERRGLQRDFAGLSKWSVLSVRIPPIPGIPSTFLRALVTRALSGLAVTLLVVSVAGVVPLERRRRKWEREEE